MSPLSPWLEMYPDQLNFMAITQYYFAANLQKHFKLTNGAIPPIFRQFRSQVTTTLSTISRRNSETKLFATSVCDSAWSWNNYNLYCDKHK